MRNAVQITPAMLRDGEPEALAVLCRRRGPAVFAYCEQVTGRDHAVEAAAEAFAQFRLAIMSPGALAGAQQAEALLRSATRRAALSSGIASPSGSEQGPLAKPCEQRDIELLAYVEDTLAPADRDSFVAHLTQCASCEGALRQLEAAEDAFEPARKVPLPQPVATAILTALARAAPVNAHGGDATAVRDEALLLVSGDDVAPATPPPPAPPTPVEPSGGVDDLRPLPASATPRRTIERLRRHLSGSVDRWLRPSRSSALLRAAVRFIAVVVVAGVAGILLGIGISELTQ